MIQNTSIQNTFTANILTENISTLVPVNLSRLARELVDQFPNQHFESSKYIQEEMSPLSALRGAYETGSIQALTDLHNPKRYNNRNSIMFDFNMLLEDGFIKDPTQRKYHPVGNGGIEMPYPFGSGTFGGKTSLHVDNFFRSLRSRLAECEPLGILHVSDTSYLVKLGYDAVGFERDLKKGTHEVLTSTKFRSGVLGLRDFFTTHDPVLEYNGRIARYNDLLLQYVGCMGESEVAREENRKHKQAISHLLRDQDYFQKWEYDAQIVREFYWGCELDRQDHAIDMCKRAESIVERLAALCGALETVKESNK